jgi:hypothetical protein
MKIRRIAAAFAVSMFCAAGQASAQESSWGVSASVVPTWTVPNGNALFTAMFGADSLDVTGSEFRIGFVRGRTLSGDWGVSFIRRKLKDGSTVSDLFTDSSTANIQQGDVYTLRNVDITGIEIHKFSPFGTIKDRVQIGLVFGGGVGSSKGELDLRSVSVQTNFVGNTPIFTLVETRETLDAKELVFPGNGLVPLGRLELAVAGIVAPGFKVRASGGLSFPGMHTFSISGVYLIGAR